MFKCKLEWNNRLCISLQTLTRIIISTEAEFVWCPSLHTQADYPSQANEANSSSWSSTHVIPIFLVRLITKKNNCTDYKRIFDPLVWVTRRWASSRARNSWQSHTVHEKKKIMVFGEGTVFQVLGEQAFLVMASLIFVWSRLKPNRHEDRWPQRTP